MAQNVQPIYTLSGDAARAGSTVFATTLTTAANDYTGISANNVLVWTAGANGGLFEGLIFKAAGTNTASVARIYINNGATNTTATNNTFIGEISLPGTTATIVAAVADFVWYMPGGPRPIKSTFTIYVGLGTTVAGGWVVTPLAGQY